VSLLSRSRISGASAGWSRVTSNRPSVGDYVSSVRRARR
jgi:hypothetical protein